MMEKKMLKAKQKTTIKKKPMKDVSISSSLSKRSTTD